MSSKLLLYYYTLRFLKPIQFYRRLWYNIYKPVISVSSPAGFRKIRSSLSIHARRRQSFWEGDLFKFLNEEGRLSEIGWNGEERGKLWRYNQHYFDDLNAHGSEHRAEWHQRLLLNWLS